MSYKLNIFSVFLLFCFLPISAQRLEVHVIKDLSNNNIVNKAWGVGGAIHLDQWVKKTTFGVHFDWTTYRPNGKKDNPRFDRMSGGIFAFYSLNVADNITIQCGVNVQYTHLKYSHIINYQAIDSETEKPVTIQHTGDFIGIGPVLGFNYKLSKRFALRISVVPTYLVSVKSKSTIPDVSPEYNKDLWLFPIQAGVTYKLFNSEK